MRRGKDRAAQFCKLAGNPLTYGILRLLWKRRVSPQVMARRLEVTQSQVAALLGKLRLAGFVKWHASGTRQKRKTEYWLADWRIRRCMRLLEKVS